MRVQHFNGQYLYNRARLAMKRKGYLPGLVSEYCGSIEVTWRKAQEPPKNAGEPNVK